MLTVPTQPFCDNSFYTPQIHVKFNEPYMMYCHWHEVTKTLLSMQNTKGNGNNRMNVDALCYIRAHTSGIQPAFSTLTGLWTGRLPAPVTGRTGYRSEQVFMQ
jgi:hypothetical protein